MVTTTVPLRSRKRRRALAIQKLQHVIPAVPLLSAGLQALADHPHGMALVLAVFEIGTSLLLLWTVVKELRSVRAAHIHAGHASHGVDWFHIFAAGVLLAEAAEHWHLTHHWRRPTLLTAAFTLLLGLLHGRIERFSEDRRALRLNDEGIHIGGKFFTSFNARWGEIEAVEIGDRRATIRAAGGRERVIDLSDCENPGAIRAALEEAALFLKPEA